MCRVVTWLYPDKMDGDGSPFSFSALKKVQPVIFTFCVGVPLLFVPSSLLKYCMFAENARKWSVFKRPKSAFLTILIARGVNKMLPTYNMYYVAFMFYKPFMLLTVNRFEFWRQSSYTGKKKGREKREEEL